MAKGSPNQVVTEITNSVADRLLTVGSVVEEQQDLNAEANLTFDGSTLTVAGNLTVTGTTTTISTTNTIISDKLIELANGTSGTPSGDAGIVIERGDSTNAAIIWDESRDEFVLGTTSATGATTGDLTVTPGNVSVERLGAGTEQAEAEVHAKRDTGSGVQYSTTATVICEDDTRPSIQLVGSANNIGLIQFGDNAAVASGQVYYDHSTDKLRVDCGGNSDRLTVDASGNVAASGVVTAAGFTIGSAVITEAELEIIDGATLSTTELNYVDGVTSAIQTQIDGKQPVDADLTALSSCQSGGAAAVALLTSTEIAILDGATLSTTELNYVDGVSSAIQTQLDGKSPVAGHSSIATVGTIGTGTWQGTAVASAYLDADTAHLSGAQTFTGTKTLNSFKGTAGATVTNILDEDAMGSNSATALATQQSIKAYADTKSPVAGHSSIVTVGTIGTGVWQGTAVASAYLDSDTAHLSGSQTFTGTKTLNSFKGTGGATVTNILDEDAMGSDSATALATQQSIKAYADTKSPVAGHSSIATVGTIGTGTWQGTAVASAYLDADTAHLSGSQTFSGEKTFTSGANLANSALLEGAGITMLAPSLPSTDHTSTGISAQMLAGGAIAAFQTVCIHQTKS